MAINSSTFKFLYISRIDKPKGMNCDGFSEVFGYRYMFLSKISVEQQKKFEYVRMTNKLKPNKIC